METTVREAWGRVLATLVGYVRELDLAEDVLQDAVVAALQHWPARGMPDSPRAWLLQTARRKAIDRFRRESRFAARRDQLQRLTEIERRSSDEAAAEVALDERLSLIFTCCHPALAEPARVALTLRTLCGLTTTEIARAFLVSETTMAQRLVRAKRKIKAARIPYRVPPPHLWPERLESVLAVVYLVFNEGYRATSGDRLIRGELCEEAIRLGRILVELAPGEAEATGLLALMLLHDARRTARTDERGNFVPLDRQDRASWNREQIEEGQGHLLRALGMKRAGPYQLQAAISAVHAHAASHDDTDWHEIAGLYGRLYRLQPSWVVKLNEIVARSMIDGPEAGLEALAVLDGHDGLDRYQPFQGGAQIVGRRPAGGPNLL